MFDLIGVKRRIEQGMHYHTTITFLQLDPPLAWNIRMVTANGILVTRGVAKSIFGIQSMLQTNAEYQ